MPDEDLFESTKMSFGDHLEELRLALFKALGALAVGVLLGFSVANYVLWYVQTPLQAGLEEFLGEQTRARFDRYIDELEESGQEVPPDLEAAAERFAREGLAPRVWRIDPVELSTLLASQGFVVERAEQPPAPAPEAAGVNQLLPLIVWAPLSDDPRARAIGTHVFDAFFVWAKAALLVGVVVSSPFSFYFLWSFVASGLYPHERRYVTVFLPFSVGLFLFGAAVAFFLALGYVLDTMFWFYGWLEIDPLPQIGQWLNFALLLPIGFGLGFQLPLVMLFLERIGVFGVDDYKKNWRYGVLVIAIASVFLTPSDWQSMVLLAAPMTGLYFGGILLCKWMPRRASPLGPPVE